ncbi:MAG TPA: S8 family serine peptidase, partial [Anaerolineales bacterium]|nr:S8 family serine peptidase [Anaerolineales bacterium]
MKKVSRFLLVFIVAAMVLGVNWAVQQPQVQRAFVEPALKSALQVKQTGELAVIVRAQDSSTARAAVKRSGGRVVSDLWLIQAVSARLDSASLSRLVTDPRVLAVMSNRAVTSSSQNLLEATGEVVDNVGANLVHQMRTPTGEPITGAGVTVAVVDSGVYFDSDIKRILDKEIKQLFIGQADFTNDGQCLDKGEQWENYCWYKIDESRDKYGHGSHVAGIIWNNLRDPLTKNSMGVAPGANILSVRVLGPDGHGTYEDVIEGIQYVVANKEALNIKVLNLSLSAPAAAPYFVDPLNRAVESAWEAGIVVLAAAGNSGPGASSITVPGNDPYIITVGALKAAPGPDGRSVYSIPEWSASGPTLDGFIKPDVVAPGVNVVSFMYNDPKDGLDGENTAM